MAAGTVGVIYEDTRQQIHSGDKHKDKHAWFALHDVKVVRKKLDEGDYQTEGSNVTVDTKQHMDELAANLTRDHARFARECDRAKNRGFRLVVLVEEAIDPWEWTNSRCRKCPVRVRLCCHPRQRGEACGRYGTAKPAQGNVLAKTIKTMTKDHGAIFDFCARSDTGRRICEWLGVEYDRTVE